MDYVDQIDQAAAFLRVRVDPPPDVAIVLGSGLGAFADSLGHSTTIPYGEIPGWPESRVIGHAGKLVAGLAKGRRVLALSGRVHFYEGYSLEQVVFPVRVLGRYGVKIVVMTNAAQLASRLTSQPHRTAVHP